MCVNNKFDEKLDSLNDYIGYVNTDIDRLMAFEPELYAAYAAHNDEVITDVKAWYEKAEKNFISSFGIDMYLGIKYDTWDEEALDHFFAQEVHEDGTLYECHGYWFKV